MTNAVSDFNIAFYNYFQKDKYILILTRAIFGFILSFVLIFDPFDSIHNHILILGLELILEGIIEFFKKDKEEKI
ncbi:MAG: hypothetical protein R3Y64_06690 [Peptostreptococcaceae bacterium]